MNELIFSILRYKPSEVSGEQINLGALFYHTESKYREFFSIKKWSRVSSFDDTLNIPLLKDLMLDIKDEIGTSINNPDFNIRRYCAQYDSELYFSTCQSFSISNLDDMFSQIEEIKKMYFQFEYDVSARPSREAQKKFLLKFLKEKKIKYQKDYKGFDTYGSTISYDFVVLNYGIIFINLDSYKIDNKTMNKIKSCAWNLENSADTLDPIILYTSHDDSRADIQPALKILRSATNTIYNIHDGFANILNFLETLS